VETWYLIIILHFTVGVQQDKRLGGLTPLASEAQCQHEAEWFVNWLTQDFVTVKWMCMKDDPPDA
jgi:hypothetical protein